MRTTVDIDAPLLDEIKEIQHSEGKSMGRVMSELLAAGLHARCDAKKRTPKRPFRWFAADLQPRIDLNDKDALYEALDAPDPPETERET